MDRIPEGPDPGRGENSAMFGRSIGSLSAGALLGLCLTPLSCTAAQGGDILGALTTYTTVKGDNLLDVAQRFEVGYIELVATNPDIDPWLPGSGVEIVVPTAHVLPDAPRQGIVINLADLRLYWFPADGKAPKSYPIGTGRLGMTTPVGETRIVRKRTNPTWFPTTATRADNPELPEAVAPGRHNPLGKFAMYLEWPTYAIHGTNDSDGVGRRVSRGCIRMYPAHIEALYSEVPIGTRVTVVDQPAKLGWDRGDLYLEVHPSGVEIDELEETGGFVARPIPALTDALRERAGKKASYIDWQVVELVNSQRRGIPVRITFADTRHRGALTGASREPSARVGR